MNWNYITGFFDGDGSITFVKAKSSQQRTPQLSFSNNVLTILEEIRDFIYDNLDVKGFISIKRKGKFIGYELKYVYLKKSLLILPYIKSIHPKKQFRINLILTELKSITSRNGRYTEDQLNKRLDFENRFFSTFP